MAHNLGYARISTADQDPQLQLDALAVADCLKIYTDTASGTKADRPRWNACLADLRPGDTLIIWKIARLGRNLRDLIDIVTTLQARDVGVRSLTNGIVDTTTANGKLVFGMFALMAEYEAALIKERTQAGLAAARVRGRTGGRKPKMTPTLIDKAQRMLRRPPIHHGRNRPPLGSTRSATARSVSAAYGPARNTRLARYARSVAVATIAARSPAPCR